MANHNTDDEYERLLALDNAEEPGDPFIRRGPYGREGEPFIPKMPEIQKPIRRRLVETRVNPHASRIRTCLVCHHPMPCDCDL